MECYVNAPVENHDVGEIASSNITQLKRTNINNVLKVISKIKFLGWKCSLGREPKAQYIIKFFFNNDLTVMIVTIMITVDFMCCMVYLFLSLLAETIAETTLDTFCLPWCQVHLLHRVKKAKILGQTLPKQSCLSTKTRLKLQNNTATSNLAVY